MKSFWSLIFVLLVAGLCYRVDATDGANAFRRCYNTSVEMHCFDLQYDTTNNRWLTASFDNARQRCNNLQSTLIIIKDEETNNIVTNYLTDPSNPIISQTAWMDAYRVSDYNNIIDRPTWHWIDSTIPTIPASDVDYFPDSYCYVATLAFRVNSFYLTAQPPHFGQRYICEYPVSKCSSISVNNTRQFDGRCYTAVNEQVHWNEARNRCLRRGGDLASFANVTSIDFTSWLGSDPDIQYWIGLRFIWYIWKDSGEDVKFSKWIPNHNEWTARCLVACSTCSPSLSWFPKDCKTRESIFVVCHTVTSLVTATTSTTTRIMKYTKLASGPTSAGTVGAANGTSSWDSTFVGIGLGVGLGAGLLLVIVTMLVIILAVKKKRSERLPEQKARSDNNELGIVREPSVGQVNDSANDHYQHLNRNLDNSPETMYDRLRVQPGQNYEEFSSSAA